MELAEKLLLQGFESHIQSLKLFQSILVIHEETVKKFKAIPLSVVDQIEHRFIPFSVDRCGFEGELLQSPPHEMGNKLRLSSPFVVIMARHLHHLTALLSKDVEEALAASGPALLIPNSNLIINKVETRPAIFPTLRAKHGMGTQNVEFRREELKEQAFRELLDRENVDEKSAPFETLDRQGAENGFGGEYGSAEEDDIGMLFAEVVGVGEEGNAQL